MRPEPEMVPVLIDAANALRGSSRRLFMAQAVRAMGRGGQRWAERTSAGAGTRSARARTSSAPA